MKLHFGNNEPVFTELLNFWRVNTDCMLICSKLSSTGSWFYIKMSCYQYRKSHCGDKMFVRSFSLHNEISYTSKMVSSYWHPPPRWLFVAISIHLYQSVFMFPMNAVIHSINNPNIKAPIVEFMTMLTSKSTQLPAEERFYWVCMTTGAEGSPGWHHVYAHTDGLEQDCSNSSA